TGVRERDGAGRADGQRRATGRALHTEVAAARNGRNDVAARHGRARIDRDGHAAGHAFHEFHRGRRDADDGVRLVGARPAHRIDIDRARLTAAQDHVYFAGRIGERIGRGQGLIEAAGKAVVEVGFDDAGDSEIDAGRVGELDVLEALDVAAGEDLI